ncbi:hypothetical protein P8610_18110 [Fictibacillus sp. UD]|uniref:hypothetical protein n=1 Tax=Fictibacillus sp. UD TaxID=3038777 RepID=UPI003746C068
MANHFFKPITHRWMRGNEKIGNFIIDANKNGEFIYFIDDKEVTDLIRKRIPGKRETKKLNEQFFLQTEYSEYFYIQHTNCYSPDDDLWVRLDPKMKYEQVIFKNCVLKELLRIYRIS